jgi:catechol 2,3-dioxygenase-like lactoylglutathione lyase family enzyme
MNFHHTCILTGQRELAAKCERFYLENFGMGIAYASINTESDYSFYADNTNADFCPFEIIGRAFDEREHDFLKRRGPGLDHICFQVQDIQAAFENMRDNGIKFHVPPYRYEDFLLAWCRDPCGVEIELLQADIDFATATYTQTVPRARYHHIGILAGNNVIAEQTKAFYCNFFGLQEKADSILSSSRGSAYLQNASNQSRPWIEIVGEAGSSHEREFLGKKGTGIQHHCFAVTDADEYAGFLQKKGLAPKIEVVGVDDTKTFFLQDPADVCVQIIEMRHI